MTSNAKIHIYTLGCKVNQCDSEEIARALAQAGYSAEVGFIAEETLSAQTHPASVIIVNTCTVTKTADSKARKLIRKLAKDNPQTHLIATGCYAQRDATTLTGLTEKIHIVTNARKPEIATLVARLLSTAYAPTAGSTTSRRARGFVKVQDGCDHACAFCIVHAVRGPMTSKPLVDIVAEIRRLYDAGVKEVVLCGIRLGAYGRDLSGDVYLAGLLSELRAVALPRLRLSSIEPLDIDETFLSEIGDHTSLCRHLHLPLQSGDDSVLSAMNRGYTILDFRHLVERIRSVWPDLSLTTDIMVGFPGETEEAFQNTLAVIREFDFTKAHVFRYSPRPGTPAARLKEQVAESTKRSRMEEVQRVSAELFARRAARMQDEAVEVLVEGVTAGGDWEGLTQHYERVVFAAQDIKAGDIVSVQLTGAESDCLLGKFAPGR